MCKLGVIPQERLKTEVKLLFSANRKSCMPRRLAQQRMTLIDLEWLFYGETLIQGQSRSSVVTFTVPQYIPSVWEGVH